MSLTKQVEGTWHLESFEIHPLDAPKRPWGNKAHGLLIYAPSGHMSVSINKDVASDSSNEFENLFDSILFYAGTYQVEGAVIRHQVTEASSLTRIGKEMLRTATLMDDRLKLVSPPESWGHAELVWKQVRK
jgi:hypothetical protein